MKESWGVQPQSPECISSTHTPPAFLNNPHKLICMLGQGVRLPTAKMSQRSWCPASSLADIQLKRNNPRREDESLLSDRGDMQKRTSPMEERINTFIILPMSHPLFTALVYLHCAEGFYGVLSFHFLSLIFYFPSTAYGTVLVTVAWSWLVLFPYFTDHPTPEGLEKNGRLLWLDSDWPYSPAHGPPNTWRTGDEGNSGITVAWLPSPRTLPASRSSTGPTAWVRNDQTTARWTNSEHTPFPT